MSGEEREILLTSQEEAIRLLSEAGAKAAERESHRTAAELLAATEVDVAAQLEATATDAAVDVLMAGHREAAAVLLDAWMRVTEGRPTG